MSNIDQIFDEVKSNYKRWGISHNPFTESLTADVDRDSLTTLRKVFTGRDKETKSILSILLGDSRRRILLYGDIGIGKSALMLSILEVLERRDPRTLTAYISLPMNTDLGTAALIALARKMPNDEWAQEALNLMGLKPARQPEKYTNTLKAGVGGIGGEQKSETISSQKLQIPDLPEFPACSIALAATS